MNNQPDYKRHLQAKLEDRSATIGVVGLGYVGLPLCIRLCQVFPNVIGFDIDPVKIEKLHSNVSYIRQINNEKITTALNSGFKPTNDFSESQLCDALILCVPTPLTKHYEPDLSFVRKTIESLQPYLKKGQALSLESTTFPGTTEELIVPRIEALTLNPGEDFFIIYSPEREDPGNQEFSTQTIPKIVGGHTNNCLDIAKTLYGAIVDKVVPVSSTKAAEMTKLLENIHRAVNIGLVNEMKIVADKMGINIHEVIDAAATKPFGFTKYSPGPGLGGHCIPIDPFYLTWKAKEYGINTRFIELSGEVNRAMPEWVVGKLVDALNERGKALKGAKVLVLGIAYKKNVDDARESPAIKIMEILRVKGADVRYADPHIPEFPKMRDHKFDLKSIDITLDKLDRFDACILTTDHDSFPYELLQKTDTLIVDSRNRIKNKANILSC